MKKRLLTFLPIIALIFAAGCAVLLLLSCFNLRLGLPWHKAVIAVVFFALGALSVLLLWRAAGGAFSDSFRFLTLAAVGVLIAMLIRALCLDRVTGDYTSFLSRWVEHFRSAGGFIGIRDKIGDYNAPYLYFLAAISYSSIPDLYLIKLISVLFDVLLSWAAMLLVIRLRGKADAMAVCSFFAVLCFPTVIANGAYWGQCDSIYGFFAVLSIYLALSDRPVLSVAAIAVSFSFKLQAIFVIPVFFALLLSKHIKIRHLFVFPAALFAMVTPALLIGKPFWDTFGVYFSQMGEYSTWLTLNAPSIFTFAKDNTQTQPYSFYGIIAAFLLVFAVFALLIVRRERLSARSILAAAVVFAVGIPLLLPYMHERYWFIAEILVVVLAFTRPGYTPGVALMLAASISGYYAYLFGRTAYDMRIGTLCLIALLLMALYELFAATSRSGGASGRRVLT